MMDLKTRDYRPISDYGIIGDTHSCALIASDASIDWCCLPDFDSGSVFAALLDKNRGGRFQIAPVSSYRSSHEYLKDTNILRTLFKTASGTTEVIDFMPSYLEEGDHVEILEIHRQVNCIEGSESIGIHFDPKLDYARSETAISISENGCSVSDHKHALALSTNIPLHKERVIQGEVSLSEGESVSLILAYGEAEPRSPAEYSSGKKLSLTKEFWYEWVRKTYYTGRWRDQVVRSSLLLKLLIYHKTGAMIAAPTTSLPETIGGSRNWDYRFSWLRDSAFTLWAFRILGHKSDADAYFNWLMRAGYSDYGSEMLLMYGITGGQGLQEKELSHLEGYKGSRPVRIGNGAFDQFQLDVYGPVLDSIYFYHTHGEKLTSDRWKIVRDLVDFVDSNWTRPDNSIWEMRGEPKHYVYSKVMSWVALDRGVHLAEEMGFPNSSAKWKQTRDAVRNEILLKGWNEDKQAFVQYYGSAVMDASILVMPLVKFLPASDERFVSTVKAIREELSPSSGDHLVYRYKADDGLPGKEGAFALCSFWLVDALTLSGRINEAHRIFEKLLAHANDLGLFSEQIDEETGELLGNFPQAFTHMVLISSAINLSRALDSKG